MEQTVVKPIALIISANSKLIDSIVKILIDTYRFHYAYQSTEGLQLLEQLKELELLLLDYELPDMDSIALLKEIKHTRPNVIVVIVSKESSASASILAFRNKADDYFAAPFEPQEIKSRIAELKIEQKKRFSSGEIEQVILESKRRLQAIFDGITDGITIVNRNYRIVSINIGQANFFNKHFRDFLNRICYQVFTQTNTPCRNCPVETTFRSGDPAHSLQIWVDETGKQIEVDVYTFPLKDETGRIYQVIEYARDLREQSKLQKQLIKSERLNAIGEMTAGLVHEINNIITPIEGYVQLIESHTDDKKILDKLYTIEGLLGKASELLRRLLSFSRGELTQRTDIEVNEIVNDTIRFLKYQLTKSKIEVKTILAPNLLKIRGDKHQLQQVLVNLVTNAQQAMLQGGTLEIKTFAHADKACIQVKDTGVGIKNTILDRIFEPFFSTKDPDQNTGLGLSVSLGIIKSHDGDIDVISEEGKGTVFTVSLPLVES